MPTGAVPSYRLQCGDVPLCAVVPCVSDVSDVWIDVPVHVVVGDVGVPR